MHLSGCPPCLIPTLLSAERPEPGAAPRWVSLCRPGAPQLCSLSCDLGNLQSPQERQGSESEPWTGSQGTGFGPAPALERLFSSLGLFSPFCHWGAVEMDQWFSNCVPWGLRLPSGGGAGGKGDAQWAGPGCSMLGAFEARVLLDKAEVIWTWGADSSHQPSGSGIPAAVFTRTVAALENADIQGTETWPLFWAFDLPPQTQS